MAQSPTVALPTRWPLLIEPQNRASDTDVDSKLVNCFVESQPSREREQHWVYKRPGLLESDQPSGGAAAGLGVFYWRGSIYSIFGATLYKDGVAVSGTVNTAGGVYRFASCLGATPKMQLGNGIKAYNYDTAGGLVEITDANFPVAFVKGWAYLDGTTYVMRADAGIQGDDINTPEDWDALNVIIAQIEPDQGVALTKQLVYVIALKEWSVEVFYDEATPTGSPLGRVQGAKASVGCASAESVQDIDGTLLWLSVSRSGSFQVATLEALKLEIVSSKPVERLLQDVDITTVFSFQVSLMGHRFYGLTSKVSNLTLVYDLDEKRWHQWTDEDGNYFKAVASTYDSLHRVVLQHETNGKLYYCASSYTTDDGEVIIADIVTAIFDADVESRVKNLGKMTFVGDKTAGCVLDVRWSDDDYETWTEPQPVDMGQREPYLTGCGSFTRRALWLRHTRETRMRLKAIELQLDLGTL